MDQQEQFIELLHGYLNLCEVELAELDSKPTESLNEAQRKRKVELVEEIEACKNTIKVVTLRTE